MNNEEINTVEKRRRRKKWKYLSLYDMYHRVRYSYASCIKYTTSNNPTVKRHQDKNQNWTKHEQKKIVAVTRREEKNEKHCRPPIRDIKKTEAISRR